MTVVFFIAASVVAFAYAGYPLALAVLARVRPRPVAARARTPTIDVLLVVHDGAAGIAAKLRNLLALDYPPARLCVHVVCDGCRDDTAAIARSVDPRRVRVHVFADRQGKSACIGRVLPRLQAELVLFCDLRQQVDAAAARALAAVLADPAVGAASGELHVQAGGGYARGVDAYWRYEKLVRRLESATGSLVGATGALYAARRSAIGHVPAGIVLDDMWIPLTVSASGLRVVVAPAARAYDTAAGAAADEQRRKRRTLAGNYQLLRRWPRVALPGAHPLALRLWGHKLSRLAVPWALLAMLVASAVLASRQPAWGWVLAAGLVALAVATAGLLWPALAAHSRPVRLCAAFLGLNLAAALAAFDYLRQPDGHLWQPTPGRIPLP